MNLTPAEKETIILTSEADETASVFTYDARLKAKLKQLHERFPDKIYPEKEVKYGAVSYMIIPRERYHRSTVGYRSSAEAYQASAIGYR